MDIQILQDYLTIIREGTISAAADQLRISQPALSRRIRELEETFGTELFQRGNRRITLTEEGQILQKRAEEILQLLQITEDEITHRKDRINGVVRIGAGESRAFHYLSRTIKELQDHYPGIRFHIISGDTHDLMDELDHGLIDFAVVFSDFDRSIHMSLPLPESDRFGVLLRKDDPLADSEILHLQDLKDRPLIISRASEAYISGLKDAEGLNIIGTYNLIYNASLLVEDGVCRALCFDNLINTTGDSPLYCVPLTPTLHTSGTLIWKKYQVISPAVQLFIEHIRRQSDPCKEGTD